MKKYIAIAIIIVGAMWAAACSRGTDTGSDPGPAPTPVPSPGGPCPCGMSQVNNVCVPSGGGCGGIQMYRMYIGAYAADIEDPGAYENFLKNAMGTCDRNLWDAGTSSCDAWVSGGMEIDIMVMDAANRKVDVVFMAWPGMYSSWGSFYGYFSFNFGFAQAYFNPMTFLNLDAPPINNGFYIRTKGPYGSAAWGTTIQLRVPDGQLTGDSFDVEFSFGSHVIAVGTAEKVM